MVTRFLMNKKRQTSKKCRAFFTVAATVTKNFAGLQRNDSLRSFGTAALPNYTASAQRQTNRPQLPVMPLGDVALEVARAAERARRRYLS
jgi:hypothetical protein